MGRSFLVIVVCFLFLHENLLGMESKEIDDIERTTTVRLTPIEEIAVEYSDLEGNVNKGIYDVVLKSSEEDTPDEKSIADFIAERGHPLNFDISYLCLNDLDLTSLDGLPSCLSSRHLILSRNKIRDFRFLPSMPNLIKLEATGNLIIDLSGLQNAQNLEILNISGNPLKNLDTLPFLPRLTNLYVCYNNLEDLSGLKNVPNLMLLLLWGCQMTKLTGMPEKFHYLGELNLSYNRLQNLEGMPKMPNLKALMIEGNPITTLFGMTELPMMENLIILYNRNLKNLEGLPADLSQLRNLYLTHNGLESLHGLPFALPRLRFLDLSYNSLTNRPFKNELQQ